jgi:sugar (pentulose or hexulose) kinase
MNDAILGLDIGTTSTKAVLFDLSARQLAEVEHAYGQRTPRPGWVEQDPEVVWRALLQVLRSIVDSAANDVRISALCLAAQSGSLLASRRDGTPLSPIITWMDGRTKALVQEWKVEGVEDWARPINGWHLYPGLPLPTIAWLRLHQPDLFAAAERFFSVNDFLVHRLTGEFITNLSNGGGMQLVDLSTSDWSPELCNLAGIKTEMLSTIRPAGEVIGTLTPEASRLIGLPASTPVVNGGHDQTCTALGLGISEPGKFLLGCGTAWVLTGVVDSPDVKAVPESLDMSFHPAPSRWTVSQSLGGLGATLEWFLRQCWQGVEPHPSTCRVETFAALDAELEGTAPGGGGLFFLPLTGGHSASAAVQSGGFCGLRLDHTRADMARAVMEGVAYELRLALDAIRNAGMPVDQLWMIGGAARSPHWPDILADVAQVSISIPQEGHSPAAGAAILAGVGSGAFDSVEAGQGLFQMPSRTTEPNRTDSAFYAQHLPEYQRLRQFVGVVGVI